MPGLTGEKWSTGKSDSAGREETGLKKRIICFGMGKIYEAFLDLYDGSKAEIVASSDNNPAKWVQAGVIKPSEIKESEFDYIVITSAHSVEIKEQLCGYGIEEACILNFDDIHKNLMLKSGYAILGLLKDGVPVSYDYGKDVRELKCIQEKNLFLNAKIFASAVCDKRLRSLEEAEFQVYSQFGEDGIIQWLIHNVAIDSKTFIEFGVEDYTEANTRFLLMNNNWTGLVMDGSEANMKRLAGWEYLWKYDLTAVAAFITRDNINQLILDAGFQGDTGILSIDLDGNDWWILNAVTCVSPRILICEYNNIFGDEKKVTVPYDAEFVRSEKHYSNLYWGCSIAAFRGWAQENGYYYMGSNSAGNNAFFVRKDCIKPEKIPEDADVFVESRYREGRDRKGNLSYLRGSGRLKCIREMELFDIETGRTGMIADIYHI